MGYIMNLRKQIGNQPLLMPCACVIVENEKGEVLLQRRKDNGLWCYAGGSVELDEEVEKAAARELFEETGLVAKKLELFGIYSGLNNHFIYPNDDEASCIDMVYICTDYTGVLKAQDTEVDELCFFNRESMPKAEELLPSNVKVLNDYFDQKEEAKPVFFLDRDGVVTVEKGYVTRVEDLEIFPYTADCIRKIHEAGYKAIIVSNQSAVGRGYMSEEMLQKMNQHLLHETGADDIYYCPHWYNPDAEISLYNIECNCRKPKTGMMDRAVREHNLTLKNSYFVGDRESDIIAGKAIGVKTVFVKTGYDISECHGTPDYVFGDLKEAVERLLQGS